MTSKTAILLMAHGAVDSLDDIEPYLKRIFHGRALPQGIVKQVKERYLKIGGRSPLLEITRRQAAGLQALLVQKGFHLPVFIGMRHWHPSIEDALRLMTKEGIRRIIALCLTPYYSKLSVGAYFETLRQGLGVFDDKPEIVEIPNWHQDSHFIDALAQGVQSTLDRYPAAANNRVPVIFSAHSLPQRVLAEGDPYPQQFQLTAQRVAQRCGLVHWHLAYQSKGVTPPPPDSTSSKALLGAHPGGGGVTQEPWLGPDVSEVLEKLSQSGCRQVVLAPIGFISDHMETLYDDDILYKQLAQERHLELERVPSLNDSLGLLEALSHVIEKSIRSNDYHTKPV